MIRQSCSQVVFVCSLLPNYSHAEIAALVFSGNGVRESHRVSLTLNRLAATLGSKSTFKKLPKRTVLTADIAQLCNLIVQPNEPLALRLSSNLMIGAARYDFALPLLVDAKSQTGFTKVCLTNIEITVRLFADLGGSLPCSQARNFFFRR